MEKNTKMMILKADDLSADDLCKLARMFGVISDDDTERD